MSFCKDAPIYCIDAGAFCINAPRDPSRLVTGGFGLVTGSTKTTFSLIFVLDQAQHEIAKKADKILSVQLAF
jgi:hypothetical protein